MNGTVKWFNKDKGFGFILGEDEKDYFVHHREIKMTGFRDLVEGQSVTFSPTLTPKGKSAVDVKPQAL